MSYSKFQEHLRKVKDLQCATAVLSWDQEVNLPPAASNLRAQQLATLSEFSHNLLVDKDFGKLIESLLNDSSLSEDQRTNVQLKWKDYQKATKLPSAFVREQSKARSEALQAWVEARKKNDFSIFAPYLKRNVELARQEAEYQGYEALPYDALMDSYEEGATVKELDAVFSTFKPKLIELIDRVKEAPQVDNSIMYKHYPKDKQWEFGLHILKEMGYDFDRGRQDITEHPFTTDFGPTDVRVTTRIDEDNFTDMTWSCIHEGGHALYEQGLSEDQYGLPLGESVSLGIHESQSRLWENNVGRSYAYWKHQFPNLKDFFPNLLSNISDWDYYRAMNKVEPSFIRVDADELTYHLHIIIRYELEKGLISGEIDPMEADKAWNKAYKDYLGLEVPSPNKGVLQDIHWAYANFGYFPTYSMGSLYAAQFFKQAEKEIPGLNEQIADGNTSELLSWLREKIHQHGRKFEAKVLCERVCGETLNPQYFLDYAENKYGEIYSFNVIA